MLVGYVDFTSIQQESLVCGPFVAPDQATSMTLHGIACCLYSWLKGLAGLQTASDIMEHAPLLTLERNTDNAWMRKSPGSKRVMLSWEPDPWSAWQDSVS